MFRALFHGVFYFLLFSYPVKGKPLFYTLHQFTHFYVERLYEKIFSYIDTMKK
jgi:type IV secretory pathway TrbL component